MNEASTSQFLVGYEGLSCKSAIGKKLLLHSHSTQFEIYSRARSRAPDVDLVGSWKPML